MPRKARTAVKSFYISTSYPALHRVKCDSDKDTVKVSGIKVGLHFKNLYLNIEKKKKKKKNAKTFLVFFVAYLLSSRCFLFVYLICFKLTKVPTCQNLYRL